MRQLKLTVLGTVAALLLPLAFAMPVFAEQNPGSNEQGKRNGVMNYGDFYIYVKRGERLRYSFTRLTPNSSSVEASITVRGPGQSVHKDIIPVGSPVNHVASWQGPVAQEDGVWRLVLSKASENSPTHSYKWEIGAYSGADTLQPGRVWTKRYNVDQSKDGNFDTSLWFIDDTGYKYKVTYKDYNGYESVFLSSNIGVNIPNTCTPAYQSALEPGSAAHNYGNEFVGTFNAACSSVESKMFFMEPSADLPEVTKKWDGADMTIIPSIKTAVITNLRFDHGGSAGVAGNVKFDIANYDSTVRILVDVDNNGSFTDAVDRQILHQITKAGPQMVAFDGRDGKGADIKAGAALRFQVMTGRKGEIHFVNFDVEHRGSIEVERLNGSDADRSLIFFDDSKLNQTRCGTHTTPVASGPNGISSRGGVHGWTGIGQCPFGAITTPADWAKKASWGDRRLIDDWTYDTGAVDASLVLVARPELTVAKEYSKGLYVIGDPVEYTITLKNDGTVPSSGDIALVDVVPAELEITELPAGCTLADGRITCVVKETLSVGVPLTLTFKAKALKSNAAVSSGATVSGGGDSGCADPQNLAARCKATATTVINPIVIPALPLTPGKKKPTPAPAPVPATPAAPALADTGENNVLFTTMAGLATVAGVALLVMKRRVR